MGNFVCNCNITKVWSEEQRHTRSSLFAELLVGAAFPRALLYTSSSSEGNLPSQSAPSFLGNAFPRLPARSPSGLQSRLTVFPFRLMLLPPGDSYPSLNRELIFIQKCLSHSGHSWSWRQNLQRGKGGMIARLNIAYREWIEVSILAFTATMISSPIRNLHSIQSQLDMQASLTKGRRRIFARLNMGYIEWKIWSTQKMCEGQRSEARAYVATCCNESYGLFWGTDEGFTPWDGRLAGR